MSEDLTAKIHPQMAEALKRNAEIVASVGGPGEGILEIRRQADKARAIWNEGGPEMAVQQDLTVPGPFRDVPMRLYKSNIASNMPIFVYLHGGGFRLGSPLSNDRQMRELAKAWNGAVISCDYVHAPEHRFPDPVLEIAAVVEWLEDHGADMGLDPDRIVIGGASAGASVAFGAEHELRSRRPGLVKGVISLYGVVDDNLDSESVRLFGNGEFMLTRAGLDEVYTNYMDGAERADPRVFPVKCDVSGMPPVFVVAAELDPIRDDSLALADKLAAANVKHRLTVYPGVLHAFFGYSEVVDAAQECIADMAAFLDETLK